MLRITCRSLRARRLTVPLTAVRAASSSSSSSVPYFIYRPGDAVENKPISKLPRPEKAASAPGLEPAPPDKWLLNQTKVLQKRKAVLKALAGQGSLENASCRPQKKRTRREYALGLDVLDRFAAYDNDAAAVVDDSAPGTLLRMRLDDNARLLELDYRVDRGGAASTATPFSATTSTLWLRDLCQCSQCVTPSSGQKAVLTHDLDQHPTVKRITGLNAAGETVQVVTPAEPGVAVEDANSNDATATADPIAKLVITWDDGAPFGSKRGGEHESTYDAADLLLQLGGLFPPVVPALPRRVLWDRSQISTRAKPVAYADWMARNSDGSGKTEAFYRALTDLHQLGLVVVDGVPDVETAVRDIAGEIGHVQATFYGELFDVVSKPPTEAENVAYTSVHLGLHQDLLYMNDAPRIQLLHCLRNDCAGGESLFSDSLRAAVEMQLRFPYYALALSRFRVPYHYERNGNFYFNSRPVIEVEDTRSGGASAAAAVDARPVPPLPYKRWPNPLWNEPIRHTAWSPPFQGTLPPASLMGIRAPVADRVPRNPAPIDDVGEKPPSSQIQQALDYRQRFHSGTPPIRLAYWHEAVRVFEDLLNDERHLYEFKLQPGQCVLFDNRRVLHGRRQFEPEPEPAAASADDASSTDGPPRWLKGTYIGDQVFRSRVMDMVRSGHAPAGSLPPAQSWTPVKSLLHEQAQVLAMLAAEGKSLWDDVKVV